MSWLLEQWLILAFCLLLLWPRLVPATLMQRLPVYAGLLCVALPLLSLALRAALAGTSSNEWTILESASPVHHVSPLFTVVLMSSRNRREQAQMRLLRQQSLLLPACEKGLQDGESPVGDTILGAKEGSPHS